MLFAGLLEEVRLPQAPHQDKSLLMQAAPNTQSSKASLRTHAPMRRSMLLISTLKVSIAIMQAESGSSAAVWHANPTHRRRLQGSPACTACAS